MNPFQTFASTRRRLLATACAALALGLFCQGAAAVTPAEIKARGKLVVGIQAANPPWGFVDATSGSAEGIDADMAKAFAEELGVKVEFVGLEVANRIPSLTSGRVDVLFATMAMLPERAKSVHASRVTTSARPAQTAKTNGLPVSACHSSARSYT